jgi:hypothetical protein
MFYNIDDTDYLNQSRNEDVGMIYMDESLESDVLAQSI